MAPADLLDARSRPRGGQIVFIWCLALSSGAAGVWLTRALDAAAQPGWPLALGIGVGIAVGVLWFAMQGARVVVGADRVVTYSLHGRPNLAFDLALISELRSVEVGLVRGIGVGLSDLRQVRFLHKAGISPERLRQWREKHGIDLILEGFPPALGEDLRRLGAGAGPAGS